MAEPVLLLRLEGPMQSWGTRSRWDVRDTGSEPTKSAVVGLLGCAMGLDRSNPELEKLDRDLCFGVRVDSPGVISTDYHTVTGYHRTASGEYKHSGGSGTAKRLSSAQEHGESTIVSPRDYLHDAAFLVALVVEPGHRANCSGLLGHLEDCLRNPRWPLYLGRKSCVPSRPVLDHLTDEYHDLESALRREQWDGPLLETEQPPKLEAWIECPDGETERQDAMRLNQFRFYEFRRCRRIEIDTRVLPRSTP